MVSFLLAAAVLVAVTLLLLLRPWRRGAAALAATPEAASARELNTQVYRDQLAELDRDLAAGTLSADDHAQARAELQRRLLEDAGAAPAATDATAVRPTARRTSWALAATLPLLAAAIYSWLGTPAALDPQARVAQQPAAAPNITQADVEKMVADLAARAEKNPSDTRAWAVLARSYRMLGRLPESARAFEMVGADLELAPSLLVEYADVLGSLAQGDLEGKPLKLVSRALEIEPNNVLALSLYATAAFRRQDMGLAISTWERALKLVPPDSDDAKWLNQALADARSASGGKPSTGVGSASPATPTSSSTSASMSSSTTASPAAPARTATAATAPEPTAITGRVSLAPALAAQVQPGDTLFVYARPVDSRMPLAVLRTQAGSLPLEFTLDDSLAMSPAAKLSGATQVRVDARISRSGNAMPSPGDLVAEGTVVKTGARGVMLQIDRARP